MLPLVSSGFRSKFTSDNLFSIHLLILSVGGVYFCPDSSVVTFCFHSSYSFWRSMMSHVSGLCWFRSCCNSDQTDFCLLWVFRTSRARRWLSVFLLCACWPLARGSLDYHRLVAGRKYVTVSWLSKPLNLNKLLTFIKKFWCNVREAVILRGQHCTVTFNRSPL